jgi:hypothetical protein
MLCEAADLGLVDGRAADEMDMAVITPAMEIATLNGQVNDGGGIASLSVLVCPPDEPQYVETVALEGETWRYTLHPRQTGLYHLWLEATDVAGNVTHLGPYAVENPTRKAYLPLVRHSSP